MRKLFLLFFVLLSVTVRAVVVDGINYVFDSTTKTASVGHDNYSGYIKIPSEVVYNGDVYSVTSIGEGAFVDCSSLTSISIPNSVTSIGDWTFEDCSSLTSISIPNSVTSIGEGAFVDCSSLTSISIPNGVTSIGNQAFDDCNSLTSITIPNGVTSIGFSAFEGCRSLTSISIPNSVTSIGEGAFVDCSSLTSISIPNGVTSIGNQAFDDCNSLTSITIPNGVTSIGFSAFSGCRSLTSISIPNSVTSIGHNAFYGCSSLTSITIPNGVTSIGKQAFEGCSSLTSIIIPNSIKNIPNGFLKDCIDLKDVYCYIEEVPNTPAKAFIGSNYENATLHVPYSAVNEYKSISPWSKFGSIVGMDGQGGGGSEANRCEKPVLAYDNGRLSFSSATDGVTFHSEITDTDISSYTSSEVQLSVTYHISVYASKTGYEDSEVASATLCWIDVDPQTEGITNGVASVRARAILIQSSGNVVNIQGADEGAAISVYNMVGQKVGSASAVLGTTSVSTSLQPGEVGIVKIGNRAVKVLVK